MGEEHFDLTSDRRGSDAPFHTTAAPSGRRNTYQQHADQQLGISGLRPYQARVYIKISQERMLMRSPDPDLKPRAAGPQPDRSRGFATQLHSNCESASGLAFGRLWRAPNVAQLVENTKPQSGFGPASAQCPHRGRMSGGAQVECPVLSFLKWRMASLAAKGFMAIPCSSTNERVRSGSCFESSRSHQAMAFWMNHW